MSFRLRWLCNSHSHILPEDGSHHYAGSHAETVVTKTLQIQHTIEVDKKAVVLEWENIPEVYEPVTRPEMVRMSYLDADGKPQEAEFDALYATAVQHELDHLDGVLFIDYISKMKRAMITNKMKKLKKERARD